MMRQTQTLDDVRATFSLIKKEDARIAMARGMLRVGNLTSEAREYVAHEYGERIAKQYPNG